MKTIYITLISIILGFSMSGLIAQDSGVRLELLSEPGVAQNGTTITASSTSSNVVVNMILRNVSGAAIDLRWERVIIDKSNELFSDQFCDNWYCYPTGDAGDFWLLENTVTLEADAITDFKPELLTGSNGGGSARIMYYVRNDQNQRIDSVEVVFTSTASLSPEGDISAAHVFPNPSNGEILIKDAPLGSEIEVIDMLGKVVMRKKLTSPHQFIDLSANPDGFYFYTIKSSDGLKSVSKKLVISR